MEIIDPREGQKGWEDPWAPLSERELRTRKPKEPGSRVAGWFIRCDSNGRQLELPTAYPLPRSERNAAKILAWHDLTRVIDPRGAVLVWLEEGMVMETHDLHPKEPIRGYVEPSRHNKNDCRGE